MPSLIDMRRRVRAVKSTQQITKAMKMVAASKLRRAQEKVIATRPYAREARRVLESIAGRVDQTSHPLLTKRPGADSGPTMLIVVSADRGLCGSFNTNIIKGTGAFLRENPGRAVTFGLVGRKGRDQLSRRGLPVRFEHVNLPKNIVFAEAEAIAAPAIEDFIAGKVDSVHIIYNEFKSVMQQKLVVEQLLPLAAIGTDTATAAGGGTDYLYEPSAQRIFDQLLGRLVEAQILRALLESNAAFYAAQMTAMDAATRNSAEMLEGLTLTMNKIRQAAITREIIEVVSGAQAL
ncbi:MAG TPA: ATP synthase F1 subunit gamma [Vicinamibacterales bacterium]|nr:ATP synthase F1 subunit gamma [Vicinamibacterales bacterium]